MFNIAIDGTTSSGKSTLAKVLAEALGFDRFDTGALYRAVACGFKRTGKKFSENALKKFVKSMSLRVEFKNGNQKVFVNEIDETPFLRSEEISAFSAQISPFKFLRDQILDIQRSFAASHECVMEGRDITSHVLPKADIKFFLTADVQVRAQRRYLQVKGKGHTLQQVLEDLKKRDEVDENRKYGKLTKLPDAHLIDTTNLTIDQALEECLKIVRAELASRKHCIVTGCTGHIGNVLIRNLLENRYEVTALALPNEDLKPIEGLKVKVVRGDITDREFIFNLIKKGSTVFHLAGIIDIGNTPYEKVHAVNVEGTKNVVDACIKNKAKRLVYTSTVNIIDPVKGKVLTEPEEFNDKIAVGPYAKTKIEATRYILEKCKEGVLDAAVVFPSAVIGPYDFKISEVGQVILDFMNRKLYGYVSGGYNFVDVRDVAEGLRLAARKGASGESYILSGEITPFKTLLEVINAELGRKYLPPKFAIWFVKLFANVSSIYYKMRGKKPVFSAYSISAFTQNSNFSHEKATKVLGYTSRPAKESIVDSVRWFIENGYYQEKKNK